MFYKKSAFIVMFSVFFSLNGAFASQSVSIGIPVGASYISKDIAIDSSDCSVLEWCSGIKADYLHSVGSFDPSVLSVGFFVEGDVSGLLAFGEVSGFEYRAERDWGMKMQTGISLGFLDESLVFYPVIYTRQSYTEGKITYSGRGAEASFEDSSHIIINSFKTGLQFNQKYFLEGFNIIWMDDASSGFEFKAGAEAFIGVRLGKKF